MAKKEMEREDRINNEIIVDANGPDEQVMGWYYYLQDELKFPFTAKCIATRPISPLKKDDEVEVIDMPGEDECQHEMFVTIRREKRGLAVPLSQLKPSRNTDAATTQAVEDWLYWVKQGYQF